MPDDRSRESARPCEESPQGVAGAHGEPGSSLPDPVCGVKVADAIDALREVLAQVWREDPPGPARVDVTPIEVTLQCVVTSTGEDPARIQWRVLSPDREGSGQAVGAQTLKIRFAPRPDEPRGVLAKAKQSAADPAGEASEAHSGCPGRTPFVPDGSDRTASFVPGVVAEKMTLVRVYLSCDEVDPTRMVLELGVVPIPRDDCKEFAGKSLGKVVEGVEAYAAQRITDGAWDQLSQLWVTKDPGGFGADAQAVGALEAGLRQFLLGNPAEIIASGLGLPVPADLGHVVAMIPISAIDRPLNAAKRCLELVGVLVGLATGTAPLACASLKLLVHDEVTEALAKGITEAVKTVMAQGGRPHTEAKSSTHTLPLRPSPRHVLGTSPSPQVIRLGGGYSGTSPVGGARVPDPSEESAAGRIAKRAGAGTPPLGRRPKPYGGRGPTD